MHSDTFIMLGRFKLSITKLIWILKKVTTEINFIAEKQDNMLRSEE